MKYRLATPTQLIDVGRLDDLSYINQSNGHIAIGATTKHSELETSSVLAEACPLLAHVASLVGDPAVRHRGTLGGTMAHADSASDLPAAVLALGGTIVAQGPNGTREIAATEFFTSYFESALAADEMITEIRVPANTGGWNYQKFNRRAQDWAIVGVGVADGGKGISLVKAADGTSPPEDLNADGAYRTHLAQVLTRRALEAAG